MADYKKPTIHFCSKLCFNFEWENSVLSENLFLVQAEGHLGCEKHLRRGSLWWYLSVKNLLNIATKSSIIDVARVLDPLLYTFRMLSVCKDRAPCEPVFIYCHKRFHHSCNSGPRSAFYIRVHFECLVCVNTAHKRP